MPDQQIFFDPHRKRWKRLRRILDVTAVLTTLVVAGFIFNVLRSQPLPELLLPSFRHNYKAVPERVAGTAWGEGGETDAPQDAAQAVGYPI